MAGHVYTFRVCSQDQAGNLSAWSVSAPFVFFKATAYYFNGQRIAVRERTETVNTLTYLHADALGSASLATRVTGTLVSQRRYLPYGTTRWSSGPFPTDRRYTGQREEVTLGVYDYGARLYAPGLGRFLSADSIVPEPSQVQGFNRYAYVNNNPLKYTDPTGHCFWDGCIVEAALIVGGAALIADWAVQVNHNIQENKQSFWDATYQDNLDEGEMLTAGAVGAVSGFMIATGLPLVAAGGAEAGLAGMGFQGGIGMISSEAGYLASSYITGHDTTAEELSGVSVVGGAANALNALFPTPLPSALIQGAASVTQYGIIAKKPSAEGAKFAGMLGAAGGAASSLISTQLAATSLYYNGTFALPAQIEAIAPRTAANVLKFRVIDGGIMGGAEFLRAAGSTATPDIINWFHSR